MIRFAVPPIGGKGWFGGWMYMRNLVRALAQYGPPDVETVLFLGPEHADDRYVVDLHDLPRTRIVIDPAFADARVRAGIATTLVSGRNQPILAAFARERIDVALAPAIYLGWRSPVPSIAWFPDFQHRRLPHMFTRAAWWKRELGFRAQAASSRAILLSSEDAERDCLAFYPEARGRTHVARFAVPIDSWPDADTAIARLRDAGIPQDFVFLPNQLWQHKNHALAIRAAGILARRGSTRTILATGYGADPRRPELRAELDALIEREQAGGTFRFLGAVDHGLVQALTIGANAVLNPSRFEGWSTSVEEAKAVGTPMLLSDLPVHREQNPAAHFFGLEDASALADAVEASPPRSRQAIGSAMASARDTTLERQRAYAAAIGDVVRGVAHPRR